jgi:hypothetical protein
MTGPPPASHSLLSIERSKRGIIPRSFEEILLQTRLMVASGGWKNISLSVAALEIYNEDIRDLLTDFSLPNNSDILLTSNVARKLFAEDLKPKSNRNHNNTNQFNNNNHTRENNRNININGNNSQDGNNFESIKITRVDSRVVVNGITWIPIDTTYPNSSPSAHDEELGLSQFYSLLDHCSASRSTAYTGLNETSSRSHLVVLVEILGYHGDGRTLMQGGMRLCDLAGSERFDRTGNLKDLTRLKESCNINKSLSSLSDVFLALHNKSSHVPFRNSKLTMLLQVKIYIFRCNRTLIMNIIVGLSFR